MAKIDDLIGKVTDEKLRGALKAAARELRSGRKFGLVYERHIPETVLLTDLKVRKGAIVALRSGSWSEKWVVERVKRGEALIRSLETEETRSVDVGEVAIIKPFGDPIFPSLRPLETILKNTERPFHSVINGENYHALQLLRYLYEGVVDCIYIDPPYNTGARTWAYNNDYVDENDEWRHSKWLSFMEKRLRLARHLLKPEGVLVVTIDEHELHHLGMLLEEIFPEYKRYQVSIVINARGSTGNRNFGSIEEQALFVVPDLGYDVIQPRESFIPEFRDSGGTQSVAETLLQKIAGVHPGIVDEVITAGVDLDDEELEEWRDLVDSDLMLWEEEEELDEALPAVSDPGDVPQETDPAVYWRGAVRTGQGTSFRTQRKRQFYPLLIDAKDVNARIEVGEPLLDIDENGELVSPSWAPVNGLTPIWPIDEEKAERVWCYKPERMREEINKGNIRIGKFNSKRNTYAVNVRRIRRTKRRFRERTIWWEKSYDAGSNGTNILKRYLGESGLFAFPKSIYAVRDVLAAVVGSKPDALILDFFAGSGTTLHATCLLNAIDDGRRRCILVTNNELEATTADSLRAAGFGPGDPEYEAEGVFEKVTAPRTKAVITGTRPDGVAISGKHKWQQGKPYAEGFDENLELYELVYLDPDEVNLGKQFHSILPLLWLTAGATGSRPNPKGVPDWFIAERSPFAVLTELEELKPFKKALAERPDVSYVWIVTDDEGAFARARAQIRNVERVGMLYREFLRTFQINLERNV